MLDVRICEYGLLITRVWLKHDETSKAAQLPISRQEKFGLFWSGNNVRIEHISIFVACLSVYGVHGRLAFRDECGQRTLVHSGSRWRAVAGFGENLRKRLRGGLRGNALRKLNDQFSVGLVTGYIVEAKSSVELLEEAHGLWREHIQTGASVVYKMVAVLPVNLLHDVLSPVMLGQVYEPIFAVTGSRATDEERRKETCSTALDQRFVKRRLNEPAPVGFVIFDLLDGSPTETFKDVDLQSSRDFFGELVIGVGCE